MTDPTKRVATSIEMARRQLLTLSSAATIALREFQELGRALGDAPDDEEREREIAVAAVARSKEPR